MNDRRYLSRKFGLATAAFLAGLGLFIAGRLTAPEWISFTQWIVGLYMAGNIGDEAAKSLQRSQP